MARLDRPCYTVSNFANEPLPGTQDYHLPDRAVRGQPRGRAPVGDSTWRSIRGSPAGHRQAVQPDVPFIAVERQPAPDAQYFQGAPDLILEVSSPSTARADRAVKFSACERAGVRESWLVSPRTRAIKVYVRNERGVFELRDAAERVHGDTLSSAALPDLAIPVNDLFTPAAAAWTAGDSSSTARARNKR